MGWNRINATIPDERLNTSKVEVPVTSNETLLQVFDMGCVNDLSAYVRILDVVKVRRMSTEEIRRAKSLGIEDSQDKGIVELEDRVAVLENEKKRSESHNTELLDITNSYRIKLTT